MAKTLYRLVVEGKVQSFKVNDTWRFRKGKIDNCALLQEGNSRKARETKKRMPLRLKNYNETVKKIKDSLIVHFFHNTKIGKIVGRK